MPRTVEASTPPYKTLREVQQRVAGRRVEDNNVPLIVTVVVEQVQDDFRPLVTRDIRQRMWADLRPLRPFLDILFDVPPPFHTQPFPFRALTIELEHVDVTLKIADRNQLLLTVGVDVGQPEPAVRTALVITQFRFLAASCPFEDHDAIVRGHAHLLHAVTINVIDHVERIEDGVLRWIGLPDLARLVPALVVSEQLQSTDLLVGPRVVPGHALQTFHVRQHGRPTLMKCIGSRTQRAGSIQIPLRCAGDRPRTARSYIRRRVEQQRLVTVRGGHFDRQLTTGQIALPRQMRRVHLANQRSPARERSIVSVSGPILTSRREMHPRQETKCHECNQANSRNSVLHSVVPTRGEGGGEEVFSVQCSVFSV